LDRSLRGTADAPLADVPLPEPERIMADVIYLLVAIAFFALAWAYVAGVEKL
jgi:hypothetical protein